MAATSSVNPIELLRYAPIAVRIAPEATMYVFFPCNQFNIFVFLAFFAQLYTQVIMPSAAPTVSVAEVVDLAMTIPVLNATPEPPKSIVLIVLTGTDALAIKSVTAPLDGSDVASYTCKKLAAPAPFKNWIE